MIPQFAKDPYTVTNESHISQVLDYLEGKVTLPILDVGQRSPLTDAIAQRYLPGVENTQGDLDIEFSIPGYWPYYTIIYSHTIEHQFNPLFTILQLKKIMAREASLIIILPSRTKLLWDKGHYHEIDHYRMKLLIERAGMRIVSYERRKAWRKWYTYFYGIRPLLRLFLEYNAYYLIKL